MADGRQKHGDYLWDTSRHVGEWLKSIATGGLILLLVIATACQSPPSATAESDSDKWESYKKETAQRIDEITAELEGLDEKDRRKRLIELAEEDGSTLTMYGFTSLEEMSEEIDAFEEETGVTVNYFKAGAEDVLQRVVEEGDAGFRSVDVVNNGGAEMEFLTDKDLLAEAEIAAAEDIPQEGRHPTWNWSFLDIYAAGWNTDLVPPEKAPKSWVDVLTNFKGDVLIDPGDVEWFATLVKHFQDEEGMTEEDAIQVFRDARPVFVDGHTLMVELVAGGEYAVTASPYHHRLIQFKGDGAPIEWEPAPEPLIAKPEGYGVHSAAEHPAAAILFIEWYLTDGQVIGVAQDRQAASTKVEGGGLPTEYESVVVDFDVIIEEFDKWQGLLNELVESSGRVIEE